MAARTRRVFVTLAREDHQLLRHRAISTDSTNSEVVAEALRHIAVCQPIGDDELRQVDAAEEVTEVIERVEVRS